MSPRFSNAHFREIGATLRAYRERAGLTGTDLARSTGWSQSTISRLESGHTSSLSEVAITTYLAHCGATVQEVDEVLELANGTSDEGFLVRRKPLRTLVLHETIATTITATASLLVPGLLQTEDYIRAVMRRPGRFSDAEIESRVAIRKERQEVLTRTLNPPQCAYFLFESALRYRMGGYRVMNEQMLHLAFLADWPHLTLRVVPYDTGDFAAMVGTATLLEFREHRPLMYIGARRAGVFIDDAEHVGLWREDLDEVAECALSEGQSREVFTELANEYDKPPDGAT